MTALITNHLRPDDEGISFDTVGDAMLSLALMLMDYKRQGFTITETEETDSRQMQFSVADQARRPIGIFSIARTN